MRRLTVLALLGALSFAVAVPTAQAHSQQAPDHQAPDHQAHSHHHSAELGPAVLSQTPSPPSGDRRADTQDEEPEPTRQEEEPPEEGRATIRDEIVVSAHRLEVPRREVGSSVTVLDREEIERRDKTTVAELLRTVPGVEVSQGGGPGKAAGLFLRGGSSAHTLVLLDGVRLNAATVGSFDFADLTTDNLERIEILRGPQSTLYGSEALGGVISLTTRRGQEGLELRTAAEAGSHQHRRFALDLSGSTGPFDYSLAASDLATDGVSAASEERGNREDDPYDNTTVSSRLGLAFAGDGRADLALRYFQGRTAIDGFAFGAGPVDDFNRSQERESSTASLTVKKDLSRRWTQTVRVGVTDEDLIGEDPDDPFSNFRIESRLAELSAQSDLAVTGNDTLTVGASVEERQGVNRGSFDESVTLRSVFVQNHLSLRDRYHLTVGLRNDDHSQLGSETTYRLTASALVPGSRTRFHGSYGTGFRAPGLNELFFPGAGNPELAPETSRGLDFGVEQPLAGGRWLLDVTGFDNRFDDLITFDLATFTFANIAQARARGVEARVAWTPTDALAVTASHTWTDSEDRATGLPLPRRPEHRTALTADFEATEALTGSLILFAVRERIDSDGSPMDDYERLDLSLAYRWRSGITGSLRLENLLDQSYEEINGFTSPGISGALGLAFAWNRPEKR